MLMRLEELVWEKLDDIRSRAEASGLEAGFFDMEGSQVTPERDLLRMLYKGLRTDNVPRTTILIYYSKEGVKALAGALEAIYDERYDFLDVARVCLSPEAFSAFDIGRFAQAVAGLTPEESLDKLITDYRWMLQKEISGFSLRHQQPLIELRNPILPDNSLEEKPAPLEGFTICSKDRRYFLSVQHEGRDYVVMVGSYPELLAQGAHRVYDLIGQGLDYVEIRSLERESLTLQELDRQEFHIGYPSWPLGLAKASEEGVDASQLAPGEYRRYACTDRPLRWRLNSFLERSVFFPREDLEYIAGYIVKKLCSSGAVRQFISGVYGEPGAGRIHELGKRLSVHLVDPR